jgi:hypothetical protein
MNELELRYGDCTVKRLSGGTLSAAMKNLEKFHYAGTALGLIRVTGQFGCPVGEIEKNSETGLWYFTPEGQDPYSERDSAAKLMGDIRAFVASEQGETV